MIRQKNLIKKIIVSLGIAGFIIVVSVSMTYLAQGEENILDKKIGLFEYDVTFLNKESTNMSIAARGLSCKYKVPLGFEGVPLTLEEAKRNIVIIPLSSLRIEDATVREFLDALVKADNRYYWQEKNGFINIIPVALKDDPAYIMNRKLKSFKVENKNKAEVIRILNKQLGIEDKPERFSFAGVYTSSCSIEKAINESVDPERYIENLPEEIVALHGASREKLRAKIKTFSLNLRNVTVREIFNALAKENNASWSYRGIVGYRHLTLSSFTSL